jgi:hypothetical protein
MALPIVTNRDNQEISKLVNRLTTELFPEDFANQAAPSPERPAFLRRSPLTTKDTKAHKGNQTLRSS